MTPFNPDPKKKRISLDRNSVSWRKLVKEVFERDRYECQACFNKQYYNMLSAHHIKSVGAGGDDTKENLITLCKFCHVKMHAGNIK